jgi:hypothetical protein
MKKLIGAEISRRPKPAPEPEPDRPLRRSKHLLDLRDRREAPSPVAAQTVAAQAGSSFAAQTVAAQAGSSEQAGAGSVTGSTEDKGSVRRREDEPAEAALPAATKQKTKLRWTRRQVLVQAAKAAVLLVGAGLFLLLSIDLPERLIGIYLVAALVYRIDSQRTFLVALIFLVMVAVGSAIGQSVPAENYAIYAFYFLVIGLVSAMRELLSTGRSA